MILPTKYIPESDCVLGRAGVVLSLRKNNPTVSELWNAYRSLRPSEPFDSFLQALTLLFLMGLVDINAGLLRWETTT